MRSLLIAAVTLLAGAASAEVGLELTYESGGFATLLKVVEPEGATCTVKGADNGIDKQTTPFAFKAQPHMYYALSCLLPTGQVWQKKIEARPGKIGIIKLKAGAGVAAVPPVTPVTPVKIVPVKVVPVGPRPMDAGAFSALVRSVDDATFSSDKIKQVQIAAGSNHFTIAQVGALMDTCAHASDKVKIARILHARVVDKKNAFQLGNHLTFSSDKDKVLRLFQ